MNIDSPVRPLPAPEALAASYAACEQVAKTQAKNFYYSFLTLPRDRKAAMCAIYAFMRYSDDLSDEAADSDCKADAMCAWRAALDRALLGDYGTSPILPAFHDTIKRYNIPPRYFYDLIDGTEMDLVKNRFETFDELHDYCCHVASAVGFVCIYVWGFQHAAPDVLRYAEDCGLAFQLTNILRDVKEDASRNRIYLPQEDLRHFGVSEEALLRGEMTPDVKALLQFEADRAQKYYQSAAKLLPLLDPAGRPTYRIMLEIYHGILNSIVRSDYDVFSQRARVSTGRKLAIVLRASIAGKLFGQSK